MCGLCPENKSVDLTLRTCKKCNQDDPDAVYLSLVCEFYVRRSANDGVHMKNSDGESLENEIIV